MFRSAEWKCGRCQAGRREEGRNGRGVELFGSASSFPRPFPVGQWRLEGAHFHLQIINDALHHASLNHAFRVTTQPFPFINTKNILLLLLL